MVLAITFRETSQSFDTVFREDGAAFAADFGELQTITKHFDIYDGDYTVIPSVVDQSLPTQDKVMEQDVLVVPIPYAEV